MSRSPRGYRSPAQRQRRMFVEHLRTSRTPCPIPDGLTEIATRARWLRIHCGAGQRVTSRRAPQFSRGVDPVFAVADGLPKFLRGRVGVVQF